MFNDLNSQQNSHQQIDDIFAETDKPTSSANGIETHRVGLTTANEGTPLVATEEPKAAKPLWLKIVPIVIIVSIVVLSGYLVYSKYFNQNSVPVIADKTPVKEAAVTNNANSNTSGVMTPSSVSSTTNEAASNPTYVSELPGLASTTPPDAAISSSSPIIDTDNDGLIDYEEVKIYHTNPLLPDTDGDGHLDGVEVKNGYNPNGAGKMPGVENSTVTK